MKKLKFFGTALFATFVATMGVSAQSATLPGADGTNKIILDKDYELPSTYQVNSSTTLTIDLNGHTITGPDSGYAIDNQGTLTIINSNPTKGEIKCPTNQQNSCIRNAKTLDVDGVTVNSDHFVALKNEPSATMTVKNKSIITSGVDNSKITGNTATIFNLGNLTVQDSTVKSTGNQGVAIMGLDYTGPEVGSGNSTTTIKNSTIESKGSAIDATNGGEIKVENSTLDNVTESKNGNITMKDSTVKGSIMGTVSGISLEGQIKTKYFTALKYAKENSKIEVTESGKITVDNISVPKGVTLVIPSDVQLTLDQKKHATLKVEGTLEGSLEATVAYNESNGTYYSSLERAIEDAKEGEIIDVLAESTENYSYVSFNDKWELVGSDASAIAALNKKITLNLNGHKVDANLKIGEESSMTIIDETGEGEFNGTLTNNGGLTIESGHFAKLPETGENATTILNGGTYPADQIQNATVPEDKEIVENEDGTYSIEYKKADFSKLNQLIEEIEKLDKTKYTEESYHNLEEIFLTAKEVSGVATIHEQDFVDSLVKALEDAMKSLEELKNPQTGDSILMYVGMGILSMGTLLFGTKKLKRN